MKTLHFVDGRAILKDQLRDYKYRGIGLSSMSMLSFILNTYEGKAICETQVGEKRRHDGTKPVGRPPSERHDYLEPAKKGKMCRIVRAQGHETTPRVCGTWFARKDVAGEADLHRATMLALLVPWRNLQDIKGEHESFEKRYERMLEVLDEKGRRFIENAQYYHECLDGVREKESDSGKETTSANLRREIVSMGLEDYVQFSNQHITESDIDIARITRTKPRDRLYAEAAIDFAIDHGIFSESDTDRSKEAISAPANEVQLGEIDRWEKQLAEFNKAGTRSVVVGESMPLSEGITPPLTTVEGIESRTLRSIGPHTEGIMPDNASVGSRDPRPMLSMLNADQRRAHDIIEDTLRKHLVGKHVYFR